MGSYRVVLESSTGDLVWINPRQVIKMIKIPSGQYYVYLTNGEVYEVDRRQASTLENFFSSLE